MAPYGTVHACKPVVLRHIAAEDLCPAIHSLQASPLPSSIKTPCIRFLGHAKATLFSTLRRGSIQGRLDATLRKYSPSRTYHALH
jgi:hypothetical protein